MSNFLEQEKETELRWYISRNLRFLELYSPRNVIEKEHIELTTRLLLRMSKKTRLSTDDLQQMGSSLQTLKELDLPVHVPEEMLRD